MATFVKAASVDEIPEGKTKGVVVNGKKIMISNVGGKFYAIVSQCTHAGGPLHEGEVKGKVVTCPWHGSQFDITSGKVVHGPAVKDEMHFEVKVVGKDITVSV